MFLRNLLLQPTIFCGISHRFHRSFHKLSHRSSLFIFVNRHPTKHLFSIRSLNSKNTQSTKTMPIVIGSIIVGGAISAYIYNSKRSTSDTAQDSTDTAGTPFVYEHLEEDLAALKDYGKIPYLLVGTGPASFSAYRAIRTEDPKAKILMVGEEAFYPYMRPPLSKEMWFDQKIDTVETLSFTQWNGKSRSLFYEPEEYYFTVKEILENENGGIAVIRGTKVTKIDPISQVAYLSNGGEISYDKCLIATGSKPKNIPVFENADSSVKKHVTLFKNISDFQKLVKTCNNIKSIVIVGGGFLGSELACGIARKQGIEVIQIFPESGNMGKVLPEYLSKWTSKKLIQDKIKIIPEVLVEKVHKDGNRLFLKLNNGTTIETDHVVVAVGSYANTELAKPSGLEVDEKLGGFVVNTEMEARNHLWIAGDASCFYDILLGRRRVEHHDHATVSGELAGRNMTGRGKPYSHQSMFWSDLGPDIGFEAVGIVDSSLPTVGIYVKEEKSNVKSMLEDLASSGAPEKEVNTGNPSTKTSAQETPRVPNPNDNYNKGIIFYLKDNIIVGVLLWNVFSKIPIARKIINEAKSYEDLTEVAKLFELNSVEEPLD